MTSSAEAAALNFAMLNIPLHTELLFPDDCRLEARFRSPELRYHMPLDSHLHTPVVLRHVHKHNTESSGGTGLKLDPRGAEILANW